MSDYPKRKIKKLLERIDDKLKEGEGIEMKGDGKEMVVKNNTGYLGDEKYIIVTSEEEIVIKDNRFSKGKLEKEELKESCDVCKEKKESTYSNNLKEYMCDDCWDSYGEACHYGEA